MEIILDSSSSRLALSETGKTAKEKLFLIQSDTDFSTVLCFLESVKFGSLAFLGVKSSSHRERKGSFALFKIALPMFFLKMLLSLFYVKSHLKTIFDTQEIHGISQRLRKCWKSLERNWFLPVWVPILTILSAEWLNSFFSNKI